MSTAAAPSNRYIRQEILGVVGAAGQERLSRAHAALIGAGALGSTIADLLVRAGIGRLTLIDRDYVELHNLQRQTLYTEDDVRDHTPKAMAAAERLSTINSSVEIRPVVADVNSLSIEQLTEGADFLVDGTDNFETRYLINDLAVKTESSMGIRRGDRDLRHDDDHHPGRDGVLALRLPGRARCRFRADLRYGWRVWSVGPCRLVPRGERGDQARARPDGRN